MFGTSPQLPVNQGSFRYGSQNAVGQSTQGNTSDEFPPLNRNGNGDLGGDRPASLVQSVGFQATANGMSFGSTNPSQPSRAANGLLSAVSGSGRLGGGGRITSLAQLASNPSGASGEYAVLLEITIC